MNKFSRWLGLGLALAGLLILIYAGAIFFQNTKAENVAETRVPGQEKLTAQMTNSPMPTTTEISPTPSIMPTLTLSPTLTTEPYATPRLLGTPVSQIPTAIPAQPASPPATPVPLTVVPSAGLPRGQGANPTRLVIPRLRLDIPVREATWIINNQSQAEWQIPFDAVGHLSTTAKPGEAGNAVISGHHNLIGPNRFGVGKFAGLWNLQVGDSLYIADAQGRNFIYQVEQYYTLKELGEPLSVREQHAQQIIADNGTPRVTFETCWNGAQAPLSGNTYRWIVVSRLVGTIDASQIPSVQN